MKLAPHVLATALAITLSCSHGRTKLTPGMTRTDGILPGAVRQYVIEIPPGHVARFVCRQLETDVAVSSGDHFVDMSDWGYEVLFIAGRGATTVEVAARKGEPATGRVEIRFELLPMAPGQQRTIFEAQAQDHAASRQFDERRAENLSAIVRGLEAAIGTWERAGEKIRQAQSMMLLGGALEKPGRHAEADRLYESAIPLFKEVGDTGNWLAARKRWMNLAGGLGIKNRGDEAALRAMLAEWERVGDRRGMIWIRSQAVSKAEPEERLAEYRHLVSLARTMSATDWECRLLDVISGLLHGERHFRESLEVSRTLLEIRRRMGDAPGEAAAVSSVAMNYQALGNAGEAIAAMQRARELRKAQGDSSAELIAIDTLGHWSALLGDTEASRRYFEETRLLIDKIEAGHSRPSQHWGYIFGSAIWAANLPSASESIKAAAFHAVDVQRGRFVARSSVSRGQDIQRALPSDAILLEYSALIGEQPGAVWTLDQNGLKWHPMVENTTAIAERAAQALRGDPSVARQDVLKSLSKAMLGPVRDELRGKRHVLVVPDERLAGIPLAMLPDPNATDGSLLGDRHDVVYLDSGHARLAMRERPRKASRIEVALITDPVHNRFDPRLRHPQAPAEKAEWVEVARSAGVLDERQTLPRLTAAAWEKEQIQRSVGGPLRLIAGFDVSRENLIEALREAKIVHISAHGLMDWDAPRRSGLVLSQYDREGRLLGGYAAFDDIAQMETQAELVVLAACQTAIGRPSSFHGVPSVAHAFLRAGARRVLASLWKVNDRATAELMAEFYAGLLGSRRLSPAAALRAAQHKLRSTAQWSHPKYWSAFVLYGDWSPLP